MSKIFSNFASKIEKGVLIHIVERNVSNVKVSDSYLTKLELENTKYMAKRINTEIIPELDLFSAQNEFPNEIVNNLSDAEHFEGVDMSKNVLICNVKKDNIRHFLDGSAKIYYTGKKFPATIALNKLYYFIPYFGKQCNLGFTGIRDLYLIKIARVGTRKEGTLEENPNDLRIVFELQFIKSLYDQYQPHRLMIWDTFTDIKLETLSQTFQPFSKSDVTIYNERDVR